MTDVAAAAASEGDLVRLVLAINAPLARLYPRPLAAVGLIIGDEIVFPNPIGETYRTRRTRLFDRADEAGQIAAPEPPEPLADDTVLGGYRPHAISLTTCRTGGRVIGYFLAASSQPGFEFGERELAIFQVLAQIAGPAVERAWSAARSIEEAEEQRVVAAVAAAAASSGDPDVVVDALRSGLQPLIDRPFVAYAHRIEKGHRWYGLETRPGEETVRSPWRREHTRGLESEVLSGLDAHGVHRFVLVPVTMNGRPAGVLLAGSLSAHYEFTPRTRRVLATAAQIVGPAVANFFAVRRLAQEAEEQRVVAAIATAAAREADGPQVLECLRMALEPFIPEPNVAFGYIEANEAVYVQPDGSHSRQPLGLFERSALEEGQRVEHAASQELPPVAGQGTAVVTATFAAGQPQGLLVTASREPGFRFTDRDLRVIRLAAEIVGPAMANARAAAESERERAAYRLVLEALGEAVTLFDSDLRPSYANARALANGVALASVRGAKGRGGRLEALPPALRQPVEAALDQRTASSGRAFVQGDHVGRWIDYDVLPLDHADFQLLLVEADVTARVLQEQARREQQEASEQAARLAALGELVGGVAHELNNPLTAVLGFSELLLDGAEDRPGREDLEIIHREASRARNIVRDLVFLTRPVPVDLQDVDLGEVARQVEQARRPAWEQAGIRASLFVPPGGGRVAGSAHHLTRVLMNLLDNAEHALAGREDPGLEIRIGADRDGNAVLEVQDNGHGMEHAVSQRVFEPFFTTKQGDGTGLGLSLSHAIVSAHGGHIEVSSAPGRGSLFRVVLPPLAARPTPKPPRPVSRPSRRARVLVIDDEPSIRAVAERVVNAIGHDCELAADVPGAILRLAGAAYDLVLCDYRLGTDTAETIIEELARVAPALLARTVITTGATTDHGVTRLAEAHGLRVLSKPFGRQEIARLIAEAAA